MQQKVIHHEKKITGDPIKNLILYLNKIYV